MDEEGSAGKCDVRTDEIGWGAVLLTRRRGCESSVWGYGDGTGWVPRLWWNTPCTRKSTRLSGSPGCVVHMDDHRCLCRSLDAYPAQRACCGALCRYHSQRPASNVTK